MSLPILFETGLGDERWVLSFSWLLFDVLVGFVVTTIFGWGRHKVCGISAISTNYFSPRIARLDLGDTSLYIEYF